MLFDSGIGDSGTEFVSVLLSKEVKLVLRNVDGLGDITQVEVSTDSTGVSKRLTIWFGSAYPSDVLDLLSLSFMLLLAFILIYSIRAFLLSALLK